MVLLGNQWVASQVVRVSRKGAWTRNADPAVLISLA